MAKVKAEWQEITIPGQKQAYVAIVQGGQVGTISRYDSKSAWVVYAGIGKYAKLIGTSYNKEGAKYLLLGAPEQFWR